MIETKRLRIKPLSCDELKKHIHLPEELAKDLGLIPSQVLIDKETQDAILNDLLPNIEDSDKDPLFYTMWIVIEKSKRAIIGGFCFHGAPNETGEVEIGYGIDDGYRNRGYMTEAIAGLALWIRNNKNVKTIKAETDNENSSSVRVLEKNGFMICQRNANSVIFELKVNVTMKTKEEIFDFVKENPAFHIATVENNKPHVRMVFLYTADERGIIFHTGKFKDLHKQLQANPEVELCFYNPKSGIQVRISGIMEQDSSKELIDEIYNHPSRAFLRAMGESMKEKIAVYRLSKGKAWAWTMKTNLEAKQYIDI